MNNIRNQVVGLAFLMASMGSGAWAQEASVSITSGAKPRDVVVSVRNGPNSCGMEVRFGDGRDEKKRLEAGEVWTLNHSYTADGNFNIKAEGVLVVRGLRSVGPCSYGNEASLALAGNNARLQVAVAPGTPAPAAAPAAAGSRTVPAVAQQATQDASQDMVLLMSKSTGTLKFVRTLDGGRRLSNADELARWGVSLCIVKFPNAYGTLPDASVDAAARSEVRRYLTQTAGAKEVNLRSTECIVNDRANSRFSFQSSADLVLVQRQALPTLTNSSREFVQGYEALHEISHVSLFAVAEEIRQAQFGRQQAIVSRTQELDTLAQANSVEKVGSIAFGSPRGSGHVAFCTLTYDGERGAAILAYAYSGLATQTDAFRVQAERARATADNNRTYAKAYANIEALYEARQTKPDECLVYVDFPGNLKRILTALQRDGKPTPVIGELIASADLRDTWAKRTGYQDYAEYQTAQEMRVNAQQFKSLGEFGVRDRAGLEAAVREMQASRYSTSSEVGDVLSFLKDNAEAAGRPGTTAVSIRDARQKAAREASEAGAVAERRRREDYAKEYPYIAVLTCGMPGHINIMACFVGGSRGVDTELKLRNGSNSVMYKTYNLQQAGQERRDGFYIDLRRNFDLQAQNSSNTLILGLKIIDRVSGNVLYQDQAARFGLVSHRRN